MQSLLPERTRRHLEWDAVRERLAEHCRGPVAAEAARSLEPAPQAGLDERLARTSEARALLDGGRTPPIGEVVDVGRPVALSARGAVLQPEDLRAIGGVVEAAARCRRYFADVDAPRLAAVAERLCDLPRLGRDLLDSVDEAGHVLDSASGELAHLRGRVTGLHEQLKQRVDGLLSDPAYAKVLQEEFVTIREDRYVLPIRSGHKNHVPGIVHGWSASGQTVYIEPQEVVEANNKLLLAQADVDREIRRILARLSKQVGDHAPEIRTSQAALVELDLAVAAGHLSKELDASEPRISDAPELALKAARHPLLCLQGVEVVPNDLVVGPDRRVLVVTGPNTGGKTVALKTAGLCVLMGLSGLHVPADLGSVIPRVPGVFTDIGDEQSLGEGRSTFSGHMANILDILAAVEPGALVLLDEIAVGTDPLQGAALAQALLETFADAGSLVVVTTHYESLKVLPFDDERFRNGAVGFDTASGTPTYQLTLDIPGASSALETARRLGLPGPVVDRAASLMGPQQHHLEATIRAMEAERSAARAEREALEDERAKLEATRDRLEQKEEKLQRRLRATLDEARDATIESARKMRDEIRRLERQLKRPEAREDPEWLAKARRTAEGALAKVAEARVAAERKAAGPAPEASRLKVGQKVWVVTLNNEAELLSLPDSRGRCEVRAGILTAQVSAEDIRLRRGDDTPVVPKKPAAPAKRAHTWEDAAPQSAHNSVDVRGQRVEEALEAVERFLDAAFERDEAACYIIHGHGTGALKRSIRDSLRTSRYVLDQRRGDRYEGGDGVTAVLLG